jgi:putative endonuclease
MSPPGPAHRQNARRKKARRNAETLGRLGEGLAAIWLQLGFHKILARRVKTPLGEIDIVARRGKTVIFVEVKTRTGNDARAMALQAANRARIIGAARWWLSANPFAASLNLRFDVIVLAPYRLPVHVKGAFDANGY